MEFGVRMRELATRQHGDSTVTDTEADKRRDRALEGSATGWSG